MGSSQRLPMGIRDNINDDGIVYSPSKYRETEGIKDLFNKSHSALYAVLTLQTAYLKANYPTEFFCALLNQKRDDYGALNKYILDAKDFGVEILPPHLNKSTRDFSITDGKILFGIEAIKDVGEKFVDALIEERDTNGDFKNFNDFYNRMNPQKTVVIALTKSGAIPCKNKRNFLIQFAKNQYEEKQYKPVSTLPKLSVLKEKYGIDTDVIKDKETRLSLYNKIREKEFEVEQAGKFNKHMEEFADKYLQNEEFWEFDSLSIFINENPFKEAYKYIDKTFDEVEEGGKGVIVGAISNVQKKKDKHGKQFAFIWVYSAYGLVEAICWHEQFKLCEDLIKKGNKIVILCQKNGEKPIVKDMKTYNQWLIERKIR